MSNQIELTKAVADMFLAFPAASRTSADQVRVYVQELSSWPATVVTRTIKAARMDTQRNKAFPPSVDEIKDKLRVTGMTAPERDQLAALSADQQARIAPGDPTSAQPKVATILGKFKQGE